MLTRQRLLAALTCVSFTACTLGEPPASQGLHDEIEKECASLKRKIRIAEREETAERNYASAFLVLETAALERLEKHKPMLKQTEAAVEAWKTLVAESGSAKAWTHVSTTILFVVEGLSLIKLGSAVRTAGRACTTAGLKGATKAAYQFSKREITDAFGKGTLTGTKKVFGLAVRAGAPPALLTGINAERYFRHDDWTMAIPIWGTWEEHELKISTINTYGDALAEVEKSRDELKALVAELEKDAADQHAKANEHLKAADEAKKRKEDLKKQLADLEAKLPPGCTPVDEDTPVPDEPLPEEPAPVSLPGGKIGTPRVNLLGDPSGSTAPPGVLSLTTTVPVCVECECGVWDDGVIDLPDGADFTWTGEEEYGVEANRVVEPLHEVYVINYSDSGAGNGSASGPQGGTP